MSLIRQSNFHRRFFSTLKGFASQLHALECDFQWMMMKPCIRPIVLYHQHSDLLRIDRIYDNTLRFVDAQ